MFSIQYLNFRLFILQIDKTTYRIVYGVAFPCDKIMPRLIITEGCRIKTKIGKKLVLKEIQIALEKDVIESIIKDLSEGCTLKNALEKVGIDASSMNFDIAYSQDFIQTPLFADYPFNTDITYSRSLCMMEPSKLLDFEGVNPEKIGDVLSEIETLLTNKTGMPFGPKFDHIGNIDLLINPTIDIKGKPLITFEYDKNLPVTQKVYILKEMIEDAEVVTVNAILVSGNKIVCDTLERQVCNGLDLEFEFKSKYLLNSIEIKVWITKQDETFLVNRTIFSILQKISITMEIMEGKYKIKSKWLESIRQNVTKDKKYIVDEASEIEQVEREHLTIVDKSPLSWNNREKRIQPKVKTNDEFFPQGWDTENREHGGISFKNWFKRKTTGAKMIFMQDPYFEDVALEFIASADIQAEYTVLTQTRLMTNTDNTSSPREENNRKKKILDLINSNPSLFSPMKLVIKDMNSGSNLLHDRYLIFEYENGIIEAYNLSNSFQGATRKQPLLITQIGDNALEHLKSYILNHASEAEIIFRFDEKPEMESNAINEIADCGFYDWLVSLPEDMLTDHAEEIINQVFEWKTFERLSTLGYYIATYTNAEWCFVDKAVPYIKKDCGRIILLKKFILEKHYSDYPIGYIKCPVRNSRWYNLSRLMGCSFDKIVDSHNVMLVQYATSEQFNGRVWGQYYACKMMVKASNDEALDILKQLKPTLLSLKGHRNINPVTMVSEVLIMAIANSIINDRNLEMIKAFLSDDEAWCRAYGCLFALFIAENQDEFNIGDYLSLLSNKDEIIHCCQIGSLNGRILDKTVFYKVLVDQLSKISKDTIIKLLIDVTDFCTHKDVKEQYISNVILPLISNGIIDRDELSKCLIEKQYDKLFNDTRNIFPRKMFSYTLYLINGELSSLISKNTDTIQSFERALFGLVNKSRDNVYKLGNKVLILWNFMNDMLQQFDGISNPALPDLQKQFEDLSVKLNESGLDYAKRIFGYGGIF